ncbi:sugar kinase [Actinomycetota bacterium]|nr:sugar kinase [Actinomycetota bacterium]
MRTITTRDVRRQNRANVLRTIVLSGTATRAQLAEACGLSPATVATVVTGLFGEGLLRDDGTVPSLGGRPITRLTIRPEGGHMMGADVGERGVAVELFDLAMNRLDREFREGPTREATPAEMRAALTSAVGALRDRHPEIEPTLIGLGLGLPGVVERPEAGRDAVLYAQSLGWSPMTVGDLYAGDDLVVSAENGAKTMATAELWFGALRGVDHALVALLGRGVGLGVVTDGRLMRGARSSAGEWGHTKLSVGGPVCRCGARGCLEAYVGAHAVLERWRGLGADNPGEGWRAMSALVEAAVAGDGPALTVVEETLDVLGVALGNLVNLTNPTKVVVGGWVGLLLMASFRTELENRVRAAALDRFGAQLSLELCRFEGDSVALGAALLPLGTLIDAPAQEVRPTGTP